MRRVIFFIQTTWAFGSVHFELCKYLRSQGVIADILDWGRRYTLAEMALLAAAYDLVVTVPSESIKLTEGYRIPHEKIVVVAHGEHDLRAMLRERSPDEFDRFAGYAVVSEFVLRASAELGIGRTPWLVRIGVNFEKFRAPISSQLSVVGYGGAISRPDHDGVDIKRGFLAREATEAAGLTFKPAADFHYLAMPQYYRQVDAILVSSLIEGSPLPPMEAAAAGRLVIGTPAGNLPYLASLGVALIAPMDATEYRDFVVDKLRYFTENPREYIDTCSRIQEAARQLDWSNYVEDWVALCSGAK
jgi:hypothetical protein